MQDQSVNSVKTKFVLNELMLRLGYCVIYGPNKKKVRVLECLVN